VSLKQNFICVKGKLFYFIKFYCRLCILKKSQFLIRSATLVYIGVYELEFGTYGLLFCMKHVSKLINVVRVRVGLFSLQYAENSSYYAVSVRPDI